jgi:hypothetical protein
MDHRNHPELARNYNAGKEDLSALQSAVDLHWILQDLRNIHRGKGVGKSRLGLAVYRHLGEGHEGEEGGTVVTTIQIVGTSSR